MSDKRRMLVQEFIMKITSTVAGYPLFGLNAFLLHPAAPRHEPPALQSLKAMPASHSVDPTDES
jgi:hypothetical protein